MRNRCSWRNRRSRSWRGGHSRSNRRSHCGLGRRFGRSLGSGALLGALLDRLVFFGLNVALQTLTLGLAAGAVGLGVLDG